MQVQWSEEYSVNNVLLDDQHKGLLALINQLSQCIIDGKSEEVIEYTLTEMSQYAREHFKTEEGFLAQGDPTVFEAHKALHDAFKKEILLVTKCYFKDPSEQVLIRLHKYLKHWLINHILKEDLQYVKVLFK